MSPINSPPRSRSSSIVSRRSRSRTNSNLSVQPPDLRGLRIRRLSRPRTWSSASSQTEQDFQTAFETTDDSLEVLSVHSDTGLGPVIHDHLSDAHLTPHLTPNLTPNLAPLPSADLLELSPFSSPHLSGADVPSVTIQPAPGLYDSNSSSEAEISSSQLVPLPVVTTSAAFDLQLTAEPASLLGHTELSNSMDFMAASSSYPSLDSYGSLHSQNYLIDPAHSGAQQAQLTQSAPSSIYAPSYSSSPALLGSSPQPSPRARPSRSSEHSYQSYPQTVPAPHSPYAAQHSAIRGSPSAVGYAAVSGDGPALVAPSAQPAPFPALQPNMSALGYAQAYSSPPAQYATPAYDIGFNPAAAAPLYAQPATYPTPFVGSNVQEQPAAGLPSGTNDRNVRVINSRPKPQCWEHGCNGRQFSTFSNLLRHQREKSGTAAKSYCPKCGAEFTRTTARNGHMAHDKCKPRRTSQ